MRNTLVVAVLGIGLAAFSLTGCAAAASGGGSSAASSASGGSSASSGGGASTASGPTGKIAMCTVFSPAALSAASGKTFTDTVETDADGVYACAYELPNASGDWIVDLQEPSNGDATATNDGFDLGVPSAIHSVSGTGYPTIASKAGASLQFGKDVVEVYTPSPSADAQATTAQFVAVAKAVIAALSK